MDEWQEVLIEQQISSSISLILILLKNPKWQSKLRRAVLKVVRVAKMLYPDAEEFKV